MDQPASMNELKLTTLIGQSDRSDADFAALVEQAYSHVHERAGSIVRRHLNPVARQNLEPTQLANDVLMEFRAQRKRGSDSNEFMAQGLSFLALPSCFQTSRMSFQACCLCLLFRGRSRTASTSTTLG